MSILRRHYEMPWRPAYEAFSAVLWSGAFMWFLYLAVIAGTAVLLTFALALVSLAMGLLRAKQAIRVLTLRASLNGQAMQTMKPESLKKLCAEPGRVWFGYGFEWMPRHAQRLYELMKLDVKQYTVRPWMLKVLGLTGQVQPDEEMGAPYIHGVEPMERSLYRPLSNFDGNTCVVGTTRSGKGVLLTHLAYQAIARGDVVVVIDPKNSHRLRAAVERACADAGRPPPLHFHPAFPDRGIRLDPLYSWQRPTELASRIESVMPPDTSGAFKAFGWLALAVVVEACVEVEDRPNLLKLTQYIEGGIEPILEASLERHFSANAPVGWRDVMHGYLKQAQALKRRPSEDASDRLMAYVLYYKREIVRMCRSQSIDSQIKVFEHNREHYAKITANLLPILKQLTSGPLGRSLSPDPYDACDSRPIMNLQKVAEGGHVLYLALDSLPEPITGSAIGAITLADMAALAGMRYNSGRYGKPITLIVDEMSEVVNRPLIQILNKGAESGVTCICAMQTMSDLADRLGSTDAARVAVGNLNNLFVLRSKDQFTQEFATETFGRTYIQSIDETIATGQDNRPGDFSASYSRRRTATLEEVVPAFALGKLPTCQFFASVSGGRLLKGRIPILRTSEN